VSVRSGAFSALHQACFDVDGTPGVAWRSEDVAEAVGKFLDDVLPRLEKLPDFVSKNWGR